MIKTKQQPLSAQTGRGTYFYLGDDRMDLNSYNGRCVRITKADGEIFDGICKYASPEYNEQHFGRKEESLRILFYTFYKSDIQSVESLEDHEGPYGRFLDSYGKVEEDAVKSGIGGIVDILFCDEPEHVHRMLHCLDKYFDPCYGHKFPYRSEALGALRKLSEITQDEYVKVAAQRLISIWGKTETWGISQTSKEKTSKGRVSKVSKGQVL